MKTSSPHMKVILGHISQTYLFDGVPNSTSHESKTPSNSSLFFQLHHTIQQQKAATLQKKFCTNTKSCQPFLVGRFFASSGSACWGVLKRWCHSPVSTQKPGRWISPSTRCAWKNWTPRIYSMKMVVVVLDGDFHPIKSQSINKKITNTKQTHHSWDSFGGVHPNKTLPTRLMEVENGALQNGETGSIQKRNSPNKKIGGSTSPHLLEMLIETFANIFSEKWMVVSLKNRDLRIYHGILGDLYKNPPKKNT